MQVQRHSSELGGWEMVTRAPAPALRPHVRRYVGYVEHTPAGFRRREVPTGEVAMIISFGPSIDVLGMGHEPLRRTSFVAGVDDAYATTEHGGVQHGVQVDFTPLGAAMVLGMPMSVLARQVVALEDLPGPFPGLSERLADAGGWEARFAALDALLAARLAAARSPTAGVAWAWNVLRATHGAARVGDLAGELGWSRRHLATSFRDQVGLPPKLYARILRFRHALRRLDGEPEPRWADIAYDCGYYDQAHFNRDFRQFAGTTPTEYLGRRLPAGGGISGT